MLRSKCQSDHIGWIVAFLGEARGAYSQREGPRNAFITAEQQAGNTVLLDAATKGTERIDALRAFNAQKVAGRSLKRMR
jgi:hypothetical protein